MEVITTVTLMPVLELMSYWIPGLSKQFTYGTAFSFLKKRTIGSAERIADQLSLTNLIGWKYKANNLHMLRKSGFAKAALIWCCTKGSESYLTLIVLHKMCRSMAIQVLMTLTSITIQRKVLELYYYAIVVCSILYKSVKDPLKHSFKSIWAIIFFYQYGAIDYML